MHIIAETKRLIIREIVPSDVEAMFELHSDPEVHRYLGNETVSSRDEVVRIIDSIRQQYLDFGAGRWTMIHKQTGEYMGWTGLQFVTKKINSHQHYYDLGYRLMKKYWGHGYATESAIASVKYAFENLQAAEIFARADAQNMASDRVLHKAGLRWIEDFDLDGIKHNWYQLKKSEYDKLQAAKKTK